MSRLTPSLAAAAPQETLIRFSESAALLSRCAATCTRRDRDRRVPVTGNAAAATRTTPSPTKGVVIVNTDLALEQASAAGTGIVLTKDGEILTNNHVIAGATTIKVTSRRRTRCTRPTCWATTPPTTSRC